MNRVASWLGAALLAIAVPGMAQIVPSASTTVLDKAGGQGTWAGANQIIEEYPVNVKSDDSAIYGMGLVQTGPPPSRNKISAGLYPTLISNTACSVGNPSSDGKNVVFLVQSNAVDATGTPNCTPGAILADQAPKDGGGYGIGACEGPITTAFEMTDANCRVLISLTSAEIEQYAGYLDPVLVGNDLFIAHRMHGVSTGYTSAAWQIAHFTIDFASQPYPSNLQLVSGLQPGNWPANYVSNNCEQFYKPTSAYLDTNGQWTVYTQADQVSYSAFTVTSPGNNTLDGGNNACVGLGATLTQSGLYSYNESNPATTWTQIWPQPGTDLVTAAPNNNSKGYAEFPTYFSYNNVPFLLFISQVASTDAAVNDCAALTTPVACAPNYDNEMVILNLTTGVPSTITNFFNPPSDLNTMYFPGDPQNGFGGTARLSVSPDTQNFIFNLQDQTDRHWLVEFPLVYPGTPVETQPSTTALAATPNPAQFGGKVTLSAVVTASGATGTVTFYNSATELGMAALTNGAAALKTAFLPAGAASLTARYNGNGVFGASVSPVVPETVTALPGGAFSAQQGVSTLNAAAIAVSDFNGDGIPDIAVATATGNELSVLLGAGDGTFSVSVPFGTANPNPSINDSVAVGDLNGDEGQDAVVGLANESAVSVLLGKGDGTFVTGVHFAVDGTPNSVVLADFNGDGIPDIATANGTSDDVSVLLGNGDGTFQTTKNSFGAIVPMSAAAGDFNGDGHVDLVVANPTSSEVNILLGNGDGTFQGPVPYSTGTNPQQVVVADFNGDGKLDLVAITPQASGFTILLGNGDGTFQGPVSYEAGGATSAAAVSDFNGDGKLDLAITTAQGVAIFYGNGDGTFTAADSYVFPASPSITPTSLAAADFNKDGRVDVAVAGQSSAGVVVSLGTVAAACTYGVSPSTITVDASGVTVPIAVTASNPACLAIPSSTSSWLSGGVASVVIAANDTGVARTGTVVFGSQSIAVTQDLTVQVFSDVPPTAYYFDAVDLLSTHNITSGCATDEFCPTENVTRAQMAVFIVRTIFDGSDNFTYSPTPYFTDVPVGAFGFAWIQKLFELGITTGCEPTLFCPDDSISRAQMAIFIIRMRYGATAQFSYPSTPYFTDVGPTTFGWSWIQRLREDNITSGCSATEYCPDGTVTRGDMAIFIMRSGFNELLPVGEAILSSITPATITAGTSGIFTVTGTSTNFVAGTTAFAPAPGITIGTVTVTSATTLTVQLTAASDATLQPVSVLAITGTQQAVLPDGLMIQ